MVQANDVVRPMSRHSERSPLVLGGTQLHGETVKYVFITGIFFLKNIQLSLASPRNKTFSCRVFQLGNKLF